MNFSAPSGLNAGFPLTPALSRRERENCLQSFGKTTAADCSTIPEFRQLSDGYSLSPRERVRVRGNRSSLHVQPTALTTGFFKEAHEH
jgi:hypothetical protein